MTQRFLLAGIKLPSQRLDLAGYGLVAIENQSQPAGLYRFGWLSQGIQGGDPGIFYAGDLLHVPTVLRGQTSGQVVQGSVPEKMVARSLRQLADFPLNRRTGWATLGQPFSARC